jgi:hypothetical protein
MRASSCTSPPAITLHSASHFVGAGSPRQRRLSGTPSRATAAARRGPASSQLRRSCRGRPPRPAPAGRPWCHQRGRPARWAPAGTLRRAAPAGDKRSAGAPWQTATNRQPGVCKSLRCNPPMLLGAVDQSFDHLICLAAPGSRSNALSPSPVTLETTRSSGRTKPAAVGFDPTLEPSIQLLLWC